MRKFFSVPLLTSLGAMLAFGSAFTSTLADDAVVEAPTETIRVFGEFEMKVPASFKKGQPRSRIVQAEFVASAGKGDQSKTARVYGMPSGGGIEPNVQRWKGQFSDTPDGAFKRESMKVGAFQVEIVDTAGSFKDRMGGGPFSGGKTVVRKDQAMTGAIIQNKDGQLYFLKMIGPSEVIKKNRADFIKMVKSIGGD